MAILNDQQFETARGQLAALGQFLEYTKPRISDFSSSEEDGEALLKALTDRRKELQDEIQAYNNFRGFFGHEYLTNPADDLGKILSHLVNARGLTNGQVAGLLGTDGDTAAAWRNDNDAFSKAPIRSLVAALITLRVRVEIKVIDLNNLPTGGEEGAQELQTTAVSAN